MPTISLIIEARIAHGLTALLDCLARQTFTDFELVLLDGPGIPPRSELVLEEARDRFLHVRHAILSRQPEPQERVAVYRNAGITTSTGGLILFADDQARPAPDFIERHVQFHREHAGAVLFGPVRLLDQGGDEAVARGADPLLQLPSGQADPKTARASNISIERSHVLELDGFTASLGDLAAPDFFQRLGERATFYFDRTLVEDVELVEVRSGYASTSLSDSPPTIAERRSLRIGMVYGAFSSAIHGPFDLAGLYTRVGLTGSESSFFNLARALAGMGHEVVVFCDCAAEYDDPSGFKALPLPAIVAFPKVEGVDAMIAWNEPDYLQFAPPGAKRYCDQQLNDFGYCQHPDWRQLADVWVSPSENHRDNVMQGLQPVEVIPNSLATHLFEEPAPDRDPNRVVWCSSPDRGLHHLLAAWPLVRGRNPKAELRIFYRLAPWLARVRDLPDEAGRRARYIEAALEKLAHGYGVTVHDVVPNQQMIRELRAAKVLAYPCDPIRYTEGFGVSVLDACGAGCQPIITSADALPSVHGGASIVLNTTEPEQWALNILDLMNASAAPLEKEMRAHAARHAARLVAEQWSCILA